MYKMPPSDEVHNISTPSHTHYCVLQQNEQTKAVDGLASVKISGMHWKQWCNVFKISLCTWNHIAMPIHFVYSSANLGTQAVSTSAIAHDICTTSLKTKIINK